MNTRNFSLRPKKQGFGGLLLKYAAIFLVAISFSAISYAQALKSLPPEAPKEVQKAIAEQLNATGSNFAIKHVFITPMQNIYHVDLDDGRSIFTSGDGKYLITGDLYQAQKNGMVNLSDAIRNYQRKDLFAGLASQDTINFTPKGETKATLYVFTDVDCGYCQKLHRDVEALNELGIELRYLAFPRNGVGSKGYDKLVSAWCADDKQTAMTKLKQRGSLPKANCASPVEAQYALGQQLGVGGTPTMFTIDGLSIPGYMPPEAIAGRLGVEPKL